MKNCYIVTGTTSGLGFAFIKQLLATGNLVYSISRRDSPFILEQGDNVNFKNFKCDLANETYLNETLKKVFESIDLYAVASVTLINNAGTINPIGNVGKVDSKSLSRSIDTNLKAPIFISNYFIEETQKIAIQKYILNISSGAGRKPYAGWATYCANKAGLDLFTSCIGVEQQEEQYPIKAISFAPGVVDTNMQVTIRSTKKEEFDAVTRFIDLKNNNQLLSPEFVAEKLLELLPSEQTVNGGLYDIRDFIDEKQ